MVDTGLGNKSLPAWIWHALKPLRHLMLKHPDEGTSTYVIPIFDTLSDFAIVSGVSDTFALVLRATFFDYEMPSAASDVLCAAFNQSNGVYMADAGTLHACTC